MKEHTVLQTCKRHRSSVSYSGRNTVDSPGWRWSWDSVLGSPCDHCGHTIFHLAMVHRLVESLVLREYDAESPAISSSSRVDAAEGQLTGSRHAHVAYRPRGMGAEADRRARPPPDGFGDTAVPGKSRPTRLASLQVR